LAIGITIIDYVHLLPNVGDQQLAAKRLSITPDFIASLLHRVVISIRRSSPARSTTRRARRFTGG
jgi:hypothetical protein